MKALFNLPIDEDRKITFNFYPSLEDEATRAFTEKGLELIKKKIPNARLIEKVQPGAEAL